jgi:hypothetical protein
VTTNFHSNHQHNKNGTNFAKSKNKLAIFAACGCASLITYELFKDEKVIPSVLAATATENLSPRARVSMISK